MMPWVRCLNNLPVKKLNLAVFVTPGPEEHDKACRDRQCSSIAEIDQLVNRAMSKHVNLDRSEAWSGDVYHGVMEMFDDGCAVECSRSCLPAFFDC
jgi:hypothetical protein